MSDKNRSQFSKDTILEATLYVLLEDGIKGIKFQSVSERAGVYPSSISYHFKTIENLIESAFHFYMAHYNREMADYRDYAKSLINNFSKADLNSQGERDDVLKKYSQVLLEVATPNNDQYVYLMELDRLFRNELVNYPAIAKKIAAQDRADIELMKSFFVLFSSPNAHTDAIHLMALLSHLNNQFLQHGPKASNRGESLELILTLLKKSIPPIS
ncbi:TetR/AcrR family transcriptional regulator [Pseudoteredinibacter isoporae]|uniref:AcrR family transcriptional regulator n=1 Tax=Pseudoteredinibacter isoporae TaxID=570281 RepID=A0A7X0JQR5_9GAMM|nr:TetR family transcriptional regulator [Pseudoteredinibacter isoporae]MBB6520554.1 AcrR family transcriptional regulator [Pseudoteredinibacter isoporae]NHO86121.1 TetR family transcriptional regulator [Pseudoteredinibacter isoporae]NIB25428.1 TetR family transcriptional regulator [Pseudoteredinibacter isoporae]